MVVMQSPGMEPFHTSRIKMKKRREEFGQQSNYGHKDFTIALLRLQRVVLVAANCGLAAQNIH